jgi:hypothetical protein
VREKIAISDLEMAKRDEKVGVALLELAADLVNGIDVCCYDERSSDLPKNAARLAKEERHVALQLLTMVEKEVSFG